MKKELRLGIAVSAVIVTVAGGYYLFRPKREATIPVGPTADASSAKPAAGGSPTSGKPAEPQRNAARPRPGAAQPQSGTNSTPARSGDRSASRERPNPTNVNRPVRPGNTNPAGTTSTVAQATPPTTPATDAGARSADSGAVPAPTGQPATAPVKFDDGGEHLASNTSANPASPNREGGLVRETETTNPAPPTNAVATHPPVSESGGTQRVPDPSVGPSSVPPGFVSRPDTGTAGGVTPSSGSAARAPRNAPAVSRTENPSMGAAQPSPGGVVKTSTGTGAPAVPAGPVETHRIQPGDTLATLAQSYYGSPKYATFLLESNPEMKDPARLTVGATIRIPPKPEGNLSEVSRPARVNKESSGSETAGGGRTYRVQPGDSFYSIAKKELGDANRWKELFALNKQAVKGDATNLQIGQIVKLPDK